MEKPRPAPLPTSFLAKRLENLIKNKFRNVCFRIQQKTGAVAIGEVTGYFVARKQLRSLGRIHILGEP